MKNFCKNGAKTNFIRTVLPLFSFVLLFNVIVFAQQPKPAVENAYMITRMAEKFHFQPRPLNDEFSSDAFIQLQKQLDPKRIFFTAGEIAALSKFKFDLDDQIKNRQSSFLAAITKIFINRISKADTMIDNICKVPFDFSSPQNFSIVDDTSYPANETAMRTKLYKLLKHAVLADILADNKIFALNRSQQKIYVDSIEPISRRKAQKAFKHSINIIQGIGGMEHAIGEEYCKAIAVCYDPHTEYFSLKKKEDFESELGQEKMIFGFTSKVEDDGSLQIENILPGSPAFKCGQINKGDKIVSVQWGDKQPIEVSSGGLKQLADVLRMSNHDKATFKIKKQDGSERSVILFKEKMEEKGAENKVKSCLLKGSKTIGFISLPAFYQDWDNEREGLNGCANDVAKEILKLKNENIEGLIMDLRYNGGGSVLEAIQLSGIFIDAGPVGQYKAKDGKIYTLKDVTRGTIYEGPLVLMVNGLSASASELLAGTLQDYHRAMIVGTPTYGKATSQIILPMDTTIDLNKNLGDIKSDSYLKVTVSQLYRVTGTTAQGEGVQPDVLLPDILEAHPQRESGNAHVLISSPIEANKYFKPYPVTSFDNFNTLAKARISASYYFQQLKQYIESEKSNGQRKNVSLKLSDIVKEDKSVENNFYTSSTTENKPPYIVENNSFEKKQVEVDDRFKEMNGQWTTFLSEDPYLQITYDLILLMIK